MKPYYVLNVVTLNVWTDWMSYVLTLNVGTYCMLYVLALKNSMKHCVASYPNCLWGMD